MFARVPIRVWSKLSMSSYYEQGVKPQGIKKLMPSTFLTCMLSDRILAISHAAQQEICEQVGFKSKISIVDVPVQIDRFGEKTDTNIRTEFTLDKSVKLIVAIGHFHEVKGWDVAIKAFVKVTKSVTNTKLLLVGKTTSSVFYDKIRNTISEYDLMDKVIFAGNRSDIPTILKASNLFILPSRSEGTPAALIEAMASGLPCIATNTGGIPEVIRNGENGFLFERENYSELAEKIINLLNDSKLQSKFISNAKIGLQKYSIETYVQSVYSHYQSLLKDKN
jgi:glycosyltransferase involved in cell wall biosynthesis